MLDAWPGESGGKGAAFPADVAADRALKIARGRFIGRRTVVLLGLRVARAFGVRAGYFAPARVRRATVVVVPHPSGVNRWYNDAKNVRAMARFMRRLAAEEGARHGR